MLPDGSVNPGEITSFNHYALGSIADWMHKVIGGIMPLEPGYSKIRIAPMPGRSLSWAKTSLVTIQGVIAVEWSMADNILTVKTSIPTGVQAVVGLPGLQKEVGPGESTFRVSLPFSRKIIAEA
jgi:alpha-L-rhamnosidase